MDTYNKAVGARREALRLSPRQLVVGEVYGLNMDFKRGVSVYDRPVRVERVTHPKRFSLSSLVDVELQSLNDYFAPVDTEGAYVEPQVWQMTKDGMYLRKTCGERGVVDATQSFFPLMQAYILDTFSDRRASPDNMF